MSDREARLIAGKKNNSLLDRFPDDEDDLNDPAYEKCKPAESYKSDAQKERDVTLPYPLQRILLGNYHHDVESMKIICGNDRSRLLLKFARQLKSYGLTFDEIALAIWVRNLQRCNPALNSDSLEEISHRAMIEDHFSMIPESVPKQFKKWAYYPAELRLCYDKKLTLSLNEHHTWIIDISNEINIISNKEIITLLNNRLNKIRDRENQKAAAGELPARKIKSKTSTQLRGWGFRNSALSDHLIGQGRLISTGKGVVTLNWDWNPYEDPKVGKLFLAESSK